MQRNRLAGETSPYLLQHADNPVNWYPWGEAALEAAQRENKPILLSIGYSACHWCHVMAHESFADRTTAELMNASFINIKVDREERPDLDKIYQLAQQLITQGSGGWPLTMFLTPEDRQPFFGGTYFPKDARFGMPAFTEILQRVSNYYRGHRKEIANQNELLTRAFAALTPRGAFSDVVLDDSPLQAARVALEETFDAEYGGFSQAPKFPNAPAIERALRHWSRTAIELDPDLKAMYMAALTLTRMAQGGIYDQLGGGFARYSLDRYWMIPHFEKMLYDNGQLLGVYAAAARATGEPLFRRVAGETADWALRDMRSPEGAFYSSLDADSEGHEGKFYVWSRSAIQALLDADEFSVVSRRFGLDRAANFQGAWHLHACESIDDSAPAQTLDTAREKLLSARNLKVWPARDEKILSAWNALMIKGLAIAARVLRRPDLAEAAAAAVDFIYRKLWRQGRLLAAYTDGRAHLHAYLDDYAFLADALLELLQARWRSSDLRFAQQLLDVLLDKFEDRDGGGFFFTAVDHERLIHRSKTFGDDSVPSGNAIAASALYRFGLLLGDSTYLDAAERTLKAAWPMLQEYPQAHLSLVNALEDSQLPLQILIIRGEAADARRWADELGTLFAPTRMIFAIPADAENLPSAIGGKLPGAGTVAYLCSGMTCSAPITNLGEIARALTARVSA